MLRKTRNSNYALAITNGWPPMVSGHGRQFKELIGRNPNTIILVPKVKGAVNDPPNVKRMFAFSGKSGGFFKIFTVLQHLEILVTPLLYCLFSSCGWPRLAIASQPLFSGVSAMLLSYFKKIPFLVLALGEELSIAARATRGLRLRYRITLHVLTHASYIISNSQSTSRILHTKYGIPFSKTPVLYPTVAAEEWGVDDHEVRRIRQKLAGDKKLVLMVGRLWETRKGFDRSIEALRYVLDQEPDVMMVIAGPGDTAPLESLCNKFHVHDHVIFTGELNSAALKHLYAACDVFLLPSRTMADGNLEGFGIVFLEANLMGKPVIGGDSGGSSEAVLDSKTGLIVDGNDSRQIADAVLRLIRNPDLSAQLGRQGRQRVIDEFNSKAQSEFFSRLVLRLMSSNSQCGR
jgi:phosphatidylinositol alpha-1,6-mannosyltransferase